MKKGFYAILVILFFVKCSTYHVSTQNFLEQFDSSGIQNKGFLFPNAVKGNSLDSFRCLNKQGKEQSLPVTSHTAVRITKTDNNRTQLYFDTIILKDSSVIGSKTHFYNSPIKPIKFNEITKIEIQK